MRKLLLIVVFVLFTASIQASDECVGDTVTNSTNFYSLEDRCRLIFYTMPENGIADSIQIRFYTTAEGAKAKAVLYDSTSGLIKDSSAENTMSAASWRWENFDLEENISLTNGTTYGIGVFADNSQSDIERHDSTGIYRFYGDTAYSTGVIEDYTDYQIATYVANTSHGVRLWYHTEEAGGGRKVLILK